MGETMKRCLTALVLLAMGVAVGVVITYSAGLGTVQAAEQNQPARDAIEAGSEKYTELMELVDAYYIGDDVDMTAVNDAMAAGVVAGLGDRWSYYVSAEDYQSYISNINNAYVGVGITIQANTDESEVQDGFMVNEVTAGGPAEEAGVLAGFVLVAVDGTDVREMTVTEVKTLVQGQEGTTVELTFRLPEGDEAKFQVQRRALNIIPAAGEMLDGNVGLITIDNFDAGCADTVKSLVEDLRAQGAEGLIFDVRNNPGGLKTELTDLLDYLLPEGVVFHSVNYAGVEDVVKSDKKCVDLPMAVLVNADSYSAAEYFACAIQEYGAGIVVGEHTFGKGYYQVGLNLSDGSAVNLSIGKYYTPNGLSLIDVGVTPDYEVLLDDDQALQLARNRLERTEDPQLKTALEHLMDQTASGD